MAAPKIPTAGDMKTWTNSLYGNYLVSALAYIYAAVYSQTNTVDFTGYFDGVPEDQLLAIIVTLRQAGYDVVVGDGDAFTVSWEI